MILKLEQGPDDGEHGEDEHPGLGDDEQEVVKLQALNQWEHELGINGPILAHLAPDILQPPHLAHGHHRRQAGHGVDGELGEGRHLNERVI